MENSGRQFFFKNQNENNAFTAAMAIFPLTNKIKYKHADYLYTYDWKTTTNEWNAGHIRSFVPNVSSRLYTYTFSCFYLLENNKCKTAVDRGLKVNRPLATSFEILIASAKFLAALATRKAQFRSL